MSSEDTTKKENEQSKTSNTLDLKEALNKISHSKKTSKALNIFSTLLNKHLKQATSSQFYRIIKIIIDDKEILENDDYLNEIKQIYEELDKNKEIFNEDDQKYIEQSKYLSIYFEKLYTDDSFEFSSEIKKYVIILSNIKEERKDMTITSLETLKEDNPIEYLKERTIQRLLNFFIKKIKTMWLRDWLDVCLKKCYENEKYLTKETNELCLTLNNELTSLKTYEGALKRDYSGNNNNDNRKKVKMMF